MDNSKNIMDWFIWCLGATYAGRLRYRYGYTQSRVVSEGDGERTNERCRVRHNTAHAEDDSVSVHIHMGDASCTRIPAQGPIGHADSNDELLRHTVGTVRLRSET